MTKLTRRERLLILWITLALVLLPGLAAINTP